MLTQITLNGTRIQYKVVGEGAPVILLHGWGCNIATMASIEAILSPHFRVYTLDFPGFGGSEAPAEVWGVEEYTQMLERFVAELHIEKPILLGHSFGGRVSILYGSRNEVRKIVLVDAAGAKPRRPLKYYFKVYSYKLYKNFLYLTMGKERAEEKLEARRRTAGSADYNALTGMMRRILVKVVNEYLETEMTRIKCPVQLIWGANDKDTKLREAKVMLKRIPNAHLDVIQDAGHYSFLDNPFRFRSYLTAFLKQEIYGK